MCNHQYEEYTNMDEAYDKGYFFGMLKGFGYGLIFSTLTTILIILMYQRGLI